MIKVEFLGPIGKEPLFIEAKSLGEIAQKLQDDESVAMWLKSSAVAINDVLINDLNHTLHEGDRVSILPPVCGG